jgi:transportin-3
MKTANDVTEAMKILTDLQVLQINGLLHNAENSKIVRQTTSDPVLCLDRLAAIFRHVSLELVPGQPHPAAELAIQGVWPVLSHVMSTYASDSRIMERTCRTLRFVIRCIGTQSAPLVEPLVSLLVRLYISHPHSCFLYLGSILVDEYAHLTGCVAGLLEMLRAFMPPTFSLLNIANSNNQFLTNLRNHPDTVDDFFRLNARFLQRASLQYLQSDAIPAILECALMAINLDHKDANGSVMKFIFDLFHLGRSKEEREDYELRTAIIHRFRLEYGSRLTDNLIKAAIFYLPTYTFQDIGDILLELMLLDRPSVCHWLESALKSLPQEDPNQPKVTQAQLVKFHSAVTRAEENHQVTEAIREFCRLWR